MDNTKAQYSSRLEELWDSKVSINATQLKSVVSVAYNTRSPWTICIIGESGTGKSMIPEQCAKDLGIGFINLKGSGLLPEDIRGFGTVNKALKKSVESEDAMRDLATNVTKYLEAKASYSFHLIPLLEQAFTPGWKGILFLDEFAQASKEVQDVYFQIIYDRRIDEKKLSDDVVVMAAMNPPSVDTYALNPLTKAAEDRLEMYIYSPSHGEWCNWATEYGIMQEVIDYVSTNPTCYLENKGRRLHNLSDRLLSFQKENITSPAILKAACSATIGASHANKFYKYLHNGATIGIQDILGFKKTIVSTILKVKAMDDEKRISAIHTLNKELIEILKDEETCTKLIKDSMKSETEADTTTFTKVVRKTSQHFENCMSARDNLIKMKDDIEIETFVATVMLYYIYEMFETNPDIMIAFIKDISANGWNKLVGKFNVLMTQPCYSTIIKEVIRCKSLAK